MGTILDNRDSPIPAKIDYFVDLCDQPIEMGNNYSLNLSCERGLNRRCGEAQGGCVDTCEPHLESDPAPGNSPVTTTVRGNQHLIAGAATNPQHSEFEGIGS